MRMLRHIAPIALALLLAGCGSDGQEDTTAGVTGAALGGLFGGAETAPDARTILTPALVATADTSVLLAVPVVRNVGYTLSPRSINGRTVQWFDVAGGGLIRRDGILVGTRGLGHDLLTADVAGLSAALRRGGGADVQRIERRLTGDNKIERRDYLCDVIPLGAQSLNIYGRRDATVLFEERCAGAGIPFANRYWVRRDGVIVQSVERVSVEYGAIELTLIAQ